MKDIQKIWEVAVPKKIQQKKSEFVPLMELIVEKNYKSVLEIGAYDGGGTYAFDQLCPGHVVSVDLDHKGDSLVEVKYITGSSRDESVIKLVEAFGKYDVIFIDGDHTYEGVKADYENYAGLLNPGGIICFHDILDTPLHRKLNCRVDLFWEEISLGNEHLKYISGDGDWGGIGVLLY